VDVLVRRQVLAMTAAACAVAAAVVPSPSPAGGVGGCTPAANFRPANDALAADVVRLVNAHRTGMGLKALAVSPTLTASATWKARHMATYDYMAHQDIAPPVARSAGDRIAACGYPSAGWGENIAAGYPTAALVLSAWLASPGHRENIENPAYVVTGAGVATSANGTPVWAQDFGSFDDSGSTPPPPPAPKKPAPTAAIVLQKLKVTRPSGQVVARVRAVATPSMRALRAGHTGCKASVAGRSLQVVSARFGGGEATCTWRLPATEHRRVSATISVRSAAKTARASFVLVQR
jgi:uncharacterized protein YkwD